MKRGFMYLVAIIDWYSRYIVGFELSNTLDRTFVIEAIQKAIKRHGKPEIMNSDQGSQFTSDDYINLLKNNNIKISMDGKGRALDNQRIERFFRSYKWEKLYLEIAKQDISSGRLQGNMWSIITTGGLTSRWITNTGRVLLRGL